MVHNQLGQQIAFDLHKHNSDEWRLTLEGNSKGVYYLVLEGAFYKLIIN